jgi:hypothetical protein
MKMTPSLKAYAARYFDGGTLYSERWHRLLLIHIRARGAEAVRAEALGETPHWVHPCGCSSQGLCEGHAPRTRAGQEFWK